MQISWGAVRVLGLCCLASAAMISGCSSSPSPAALPDAAPLSCPEAETSCSDGCVDTQRDPLNCGACGVQCPADFVCQDGTCNVGCAEGLARCGQSCVDMTRDENNCGACGTSCAAGELCTQSQCSLTCLGGATRCENQCVDVDNDPANCGGCGVQCASGEVCSSGTCAIECLGGTTLCSDRCVDTDNDLNNCGGCGLSCGPGEVCSGGACGAPSCAPGAIEICYSGSLDTIGIGACQAGTKTCLASGAGFGDCVGEVVPLAQEVCGDAIDNNCDGVVDEGCNPHSCKAILAADPSAADGVYTIDVDGPTGPLAPVQVNCDMTRDGGGWTLMLKDYFQSGVFGITGSFGTVVDGLTRKGTAYKLSDDVIRTLIGDTNNFDVLADQSGFNSFYSTGNYEYAVLRNYTGAWRFDAPVSSSTTPTTLESFRASDGGLAWRGELACGYGGAGINCYGLVSGSPSTNPAAGSGCALNMGKASNSAWHHFYMAETNTDTYMYLCNGPQHSSGFNMNHRWWVRERN